MKLVLLLCFGLLILFAVKRPVPADEHPKSSCISCHGDRARMRALGAESMYLDPLLIDERIGMGGVPTCSDCHLGNPRAFDKERAHAGMLEAVLAPNIRRDPVARGEAGVADFRWHDRELLREIDRPSLVTNTCIRCHPAGGQF